MNTVFLVIGPESAGNHVTSWILTQMGCFGDPSVGGNAKAIPSSLSQLMGDIQRLDRFARGETGDLGEAAEHGGPLVYFQSVPHGNDWPDVEAIRGRFQDAGYEMKTVVVVRDWTANLLSNYYHRGGGVLWMKKMIGMLEEEWAWIGERLRILKPFFFFNTSLLFKDPSAAAAGLEWFTGLKWPHADFRMIRDVDRKHHAFLKIHGIKDFGSEGREEIQRLGREQ